MSESSLVMRVYGHERDDTVLREDARRLLRGLHLGHGACAGGFFFSSRRRHTRFDCDWSSDVCSSDLVMRKIERFAKPVIAAINGHALGGGCEIAMACHFRLLKETARMGQTESNLGIKIGRASCRERV